MEARLSALFKSGEEYEIVERFKGEVLKGKTYLPLFPYFASVIMKLKIIKFFLNLNHIFLFYSWKLPPLGHIEF